jgi:hypothetical protein
MTFTNRGIAAQFAACALAVVAAASVAAQSAQQSIGSFVADDQAAAPGDIVLVGVEMGESIFSLFHRDHSITGCTVTMPNALQLQSRDDGKTYDLVGRLAGIKPGERVRIVGRKLKKTADAPRLFLVEKVSQSFGACTAEAAKP